MDKPADEGGRGFRRARFDSGLRHIPRVSPARVERED